MRRLRLLFAAATLAVAGCSSEPPRIGDLRMEVSPSEARPYSRIHLRYRGPSEMLAVKPRPDVAITGVGSVLEGRSGGRWKPLYQLAMPTTIADIPTACVHNPVQDGLPVYGVLAGVRQELVVPPVPPGDYRIRKSVGFDGKTVELTAPLRVLAPRRRATRRSATLRGRCAQVLHQGMSAALLRRTRLL